MMQNLPDNYRAIVFGASGAIGGAFVRALRHDPRCAMVYAGARIPPAAIDAKIRPFAFDLGDEPSIERAVAGIAQDGSVHLVLVATGALHDAHMQPEKTWRTLNTEALTHAYAVNAIGPTLIAKHTLSLLSSEERTIFAALSARVGSTEDNSLGGWHSYRASKAALNMLMRCFAIELARRAPKAVCASLHPGTVDSALSKPFQRGVKTLFSPNDAAANLLNTLDALLPGDSGGLFAFNGARIPF